MHRNPKDGNGEVLLVDKPAGWTSHDVVQKLRGLLHLRKVGHAGTLDPRATGLLIVVTGPMTRKLSLLMELDKEYRGTMVIGARTPSFDAETEVVERGDCSSVTEGALRSLLREYVGEISQTPPLYSAVKYKGLPLYKYARRGVHVERPQRRVTISALDLLSFAPPEVEFRAVCSKGTYIRSLVDDIGQRLGCGAFLKSLVRTRVGTYSLDDALTIPELEALCTRPNSVERR